MPGHEHTRSELKKQLLADLDRARLALSRHSVEVAEQLSPAAIVERSFKKHRVIWIAGAAAAGALALRVILTPTRSKNERDNFSKSGTKSRLLQLLAGPLFVVGRKAALEFATQYFKKHFKQQFPSSGTEQDPI